MDGPAAKEQIEAAPPHYGAFISYSHLDLAAAKRLHRQLERYRIPQRLVGSATSDGPLAKRLRPIFRDIDELPASDDLSAEIQAALAASAALIVVASPAAKASRWVGREIETFRSLHGASRPVLIALIESEPAAAFPDALAAEAIEPVAADFRKGHDGRRLALLKLVAGLTGVSLDSLVQRDAQARLRRVTAITVAALIAVVVMAGLLVVTLRARAEADRQRNEAEGLVEYMLTDLREKLKGVDRLDVMTGVNERAMAYYGDQQSLDGLPPESLNRRARILHAMGEDDEKRGDLALALKKFTEAHRTTAAVLARKPDDAEAIFAHAQSEYWLGYIFQKKGDISQSLAHNQRYARLAKSYVNSASNKRAAAMELGWAENALGALYLTRLNEPDIARTHLETYRSIFARLVNEDQSDVKARFSLSDAHGWIADTYFASANYGLARHHREEQGRQLTALLVLDQHNNSYRLQMMTVHSELFRICVRNNDLTCARAHVDAARQVTGSPWGIDQSNLDWQRSIARLRFNRAYLLEKTGHIHEARQEFALLKALVRSKSDRRIQAAIFDAAMLTGMEKLRQRLSIKGN